MPSNIQVQQIRPDFSGSNATRAQASDDLMKAYRYPGEMLDRLDKQQALAKEEQRYQTEQARLKVLDDRQAKQWEKSYALQGLSETRAAEEQAQKMATVEAQAKASEYLNAGRQDVVTPQQADVILNAFNKNPKADVLGLQAQAVKAYNTSPVMQKQFLGNVNIDQGPIERTVKTIDPMTGQVVDKLMQVNPDMKEAQTRKDTILAGLDKTIADDKRLQAEWAMFKAKEAGENSRLNKQLAAKAKEGKEATITMHKITPQGVQTLEVPESMKNEMIADNWNLGKFGYAPGTSGNKYADVKSIYSSPELTAMASKLGPIDSDRMMKPLGELQTRYKGIITPGELVNIGMTSSTDRGIWGDSSINQNLMKNQVVDAILSSPKNTDDRATVDKAVTTIMKQYW